MKMALFANLILMTSLSVFAKESPKGALPELRIQGTNEDENEKKSLQSEVLISKTEQKAIDSLNAILKKRKGTPEEADLWYRLAELYMRRAKSGRFFDLHRNQNEAVRFAPPEVQSESASNNLKKAIQIYVKIDRDFPKFREMDAVLFNAGFASQQIGLNKQAEGLYMKMLQSHSKSSLVPDANLALGEIKYQAQNFSGALENFKNIEKYPQSRVYSYGMYKGAWAHYNLRQTDEAIHQLIQVVKYHDPRKAGQNPNQKVTYNLRGEAIRDLTIFFGETSSADKAFQFFSQITTPEELGDALITLGKLYDSHSRHKEMVVFLNEYINKKPQSPQRIKAQLQIVEANESLRNRPEVLKQLEALDQVCHKDSVWAVENAKIYDESCNYDFAKVNIDIAKKWWDIWLKNKTSKDAKDFARLTQRAFQIHLDREDPAKPDSKSRYAYAELLYQLEDYRKASEQYFLVGEKTQDSVLKHDSDYSALVALEKISEKDKKSDDSNQMLRLSERYLQRNPKGEHATQVQFKIGFLAYETKSYTEALKWLRPLAQDTRSGEFKRKSEDLVLDILNGQKDYTGLKDFSKTLLAQNKDESRKLSLTKIMQEADYTEIQEYAKSAEKPKAAQKIYGFYRDNKTSPLAKDSLWQAMSLYYSAGRSVDGADLALEYAQIYPDDSRSLASLKDAAKAFSDTGHLLKAAQTMELVAKKSPKEAANYIEAASELYLLEGNQKKAVANLEQLITPESKDQHGKLYSKILSSMKGQENSADYLKIENKIASLGQEPYSSEIRLKRAQQLWDSKKSSEAFNAAKSLVANDKGIPDEVRAKARLIQAKVLEEEFIQQSTKTTLEKLQVVLSLKTEKLDKAQTAYLTSAKISQNPNVQLEALQGLNRIYKNYVETVGHPIMKSNLKEDEKKALSEELAKLTKPIAEKMDETGKKLLSLAKDSKAVRSDNVDFANLPAEATVKAKIQNPTPEKLKAYLPIYIENNTDMNYSRFQDSKTEKCSFSEADQSLALSGLVQKANVCLSQNNMDVAERIASQMSRNEPKMALGTFYFSVIAEARNQSEKALWLIDLSLKKNEDYNFSSYQKARILYHLKDYATANKLFIKSSDLKLNAVEVQLMHGLVSFGEGDCYTVIDDFAKFDAKSLYGFGLGPALAECHAQKGELDKAFAVIKEQLKFNAFNVDLLLQAAYMYELYKSETPNTIAAYESALKAASQPEMKDWIQRKINSLKPSHSVVSLNE